MNAKLKDILERAETWPPAAQEQLALIAAEIEAEFGGTYHATPEELEAIDRGIKDADEGRFVSEEQMKEMLAKYRRK